MVKFIPMRRSKPLIDRLSRLSDDKTLRAWSEQGDGVVARAEVVEWLMKKINHDNNTRMLLESLRATLLQDLLSADKDDTPADQNTTKSLSWFVSSKFTFVAIAGALLAICGGFSGIVSILNTFAMPVVVVIAVGVLFAAISFTFFYHFDRVEMSNILGAKLEKSHQLLDICVSQVEQIKTIRKYIDASFVKITDTDELQALLKMVEMLDIRYRGLDDLRQAYITKLKNPYLKAVKLAMAIMEGVFIGADGFFAGQSLALVVAGFFTTSISVTFWPIPVAGFVLGFAAFGVYYLVNRPGYENRVGYLLGFDKEAIETFSSSEIVNKQQEKLQRLEEKVVDKLRSQQRIEHLSQRIEAIDKAQYQPTVQALSSALTPSQGEGNIGIGGDKTTQIVVGSHVPIPKITTCRDLLFNHKRSRSLDDIKEHTPGFESLFA